MSPINKQHRLRFDSPRPYSLPIQRVQPRPSRIPERNAHPTIAGQSSLPPQVARVQPQMQVCNLPLTLPSQQRNSFRFQAATGSPLQIYFGKELVTPSTYQNTRAGLQFGEIGIRHDHSRIPFPGQAPQARASGYPVSYGNQSYGIPQNNRPHCTNSGSLYPLVSSLHQSLPQEQRVIYPPVGSVSNFQNMDTVSVPGISPRGPAFSLPNRSNSTIPGSRIVRRFLQYQGSSESYFRRVPHEHIARFTAPPPVAANNVAARVQPLCQFLNFSVPQSLRDSNRMERLHRTPTGDVTPLAPEDEPQLAEETQCNRNQPSRENQATMDNQSNVDEKS